MAAPLSFWTTTRIAADTGVTVQAVAHVATEAGVEPAMSVNGINYYDDAARDRIRDAIAAALAAELRGDPAANDVTGPGTVSDRLRNMLVGARRERSGGR